MRIGEISRATGIPVRTIRFYEDSGLLAAADRTNSGYRVFSDRHTGQLKFIRQARNLSLTLDQIREILDASSGETSTCDCVRMTIEQRMESIDRRIAQLRAMRAELARTAERLDNPTRPVDSADICPAIEDRSPIPEPALDSPVDWRP